MIKSNNGTTAGAGDNIATYSDLLNQYAWMVLEGINGRQWLFGMNADNDDQEWYVGYSAQAGFTATAGTTTVMPTASDQANILSTPGGTTVDLFPARDIITHIMVDDASDAFYLLGIVQSTLIPTTLIFGDPVTQANALDNDPFVTGAQFLSYSSSITSDTSGPWAETNSLAKSWYGYLTGSFQETYAAHIAFGGSSNRIAPANATNAGGTNYFDSYDETFPVIWGRDLSFGAPAGYKGISSIFRNVSTARACSDTLSVSTTRDYFLTGTTGGGCNVALPWNGDLPL
jgi:hypothetical protein